MRKLVLLLAAAAALAFAGSAEAKLVRDPSSRVDKLASAVAGTNLNVFGEDDWNEWAALQGNPDPSDASATLGFVSILAPPGDWRYHSMFVNPDHWPALQKAASLGIDRATGAYGSPSTLYKTAVSIFTLTHEAYHYKLFSRDEGRVNACALQAFPGVLTNQFNVSPTIVGSKKRSVWVKVAHRVKVGRRWVTRYGWTTVKRDVWVDVPNPLFETLVADAQDFYKNQQAAPYNTGTCY